MTEGVPTRYEFDAALESIRREVETMGEHLGGQLGEIKAQLQTLLEGRNQSTADIAALMVRVEALERSDRAGKSARWSLTIAVVAALLGHLLQFVLRR